MSDSLADDLLFGAGSIAKFVHGRDTKKTRRQIYHAHERGFIPVWKQGDQLISTKSALRAHYAPPPKIEAAE
jgi:hypothetical protein